MSHPVPDHQYRDGRLGGAAPRHASGAATRLAVLPQLRLWGLWVVVLSAAVLTLGFVATDVHGFSADEFTVDQDLSRHHDGVLTVLAMTLNYVFSPVGAVLVIALCCLFLLVVRKSPVNAIAFGGTAAAGYLSSQFFKAIVERQRPNPALLFDPLAPETGSNSFPSGHVALAVGLAWAFWFLARHTRWSRLAAILGVVVPVVLAWSRLYIGVHYPTDVIASFLAATAAVLLFVGVWNRFQGSVLPRIPLLERFGPVRAGAAPAARH
ncbi:phosphatase PAP2 family protein [Arthrobacter sp. STN4]|uniref:phosphatase PAP2 family protein n=1 Tax=Arthrobacter sp. STN4 TaxID=2923276 RepID=UPI00211A2CFB|nr:phosphatase PAP2 family protein [Arthrobacter sp. STN4]MCQ9164649.1 phosphatase PAP2 family protein [Arthrobacter sp. STN4]